MNLKHILKTPLLAISGLLLLCAGCASPDLKPFADSTANLHQSVVKSQKIIRSEMAVIVEKRTATAPAVLKKAEVEIPNSFKPRVAFMEAMVNYSDSLAAVADAGKSGEANAKALGDSVQQLAAAAGPYGEAVGAGVKILAKVYGAVAQGLAVNSLRDATAKADPIIQAGAEIMSKDMSNIVDVLQAGEVDLTTSLQEPYQQDIIVRKQLLKFRQGKRDEITAAVGQPNWAQLLAEHNKGMAEVDTILERMDKWYLPMQQEQADVKARFESEADLADTTARGFQQWAKVHADLVKALQENRQPNIRELVSTILEIKDDIEQLKKH